MNTLNGYSKSTLTDSYLLSAAGGHIPMRSDPTALTVVNPSYKWEALTAVNQWALIVELSGYVTVLLSVTFSLSSLASQHIYLISTTHDNAQLVQLGSNAYTSNSSVLVRVVKATATKYYVEVLNTYGYNGVTTVKFPCLMTVIGGEKAYPVIEYEKDANGNSTGKIIPSPHNEEHTEVAALTSSYNISKNFISEFAQKPYIESLVSALDLNTLHLEGVYGNTKTNIVSSLGNAPSDRPSGECRLENLTCGNNTYGFLILYSKDASNNYGIWSRAWSDTAHSSWNQFIHSGNYSKFLPKYNGGTMTKDSIIYAHTELLKNKLSYSTASKLDYTVLSYLKFDPSDNGGRTSYLLIAELPRVAGLSTDVSLIGTMYGHRGGNLSLTAAYHIVALYVVYSSDSSEHYKLYIDPYTSSALEPYIVKYNNKLYLALRKNGSTDTVYFIGYALGISDTHIKLDVPTNSELPTGMEIVYSPSYNSYYLGTDRLYTSAGGLYILHSGNYTQYLPTYAGSRMDKNSAFYKRYINVNGTDYAFVSCTNAANSATIFAPTTAGTQGLVLTSNGSGAPVWENVLTYKSYTNRDSFELFDTLPLLILGTRLGDNSEIVSAPDNEAPYYKVWKCTGVTLYQADQMMYFNPGDTIYLESWVMRPSGATGTAGIYYTGIEFQDKLGKWVNSNSGCLYIGDEGWTCPCDGKWYKRCSSYSIPSSHTAYNGSDGGGYYKGRVRVWINFLNGTIPTYFGGIKIYKGLSIGSSTAILNSITSSWYMAKTPMSLKTSGLSNDLTVANRGGLFSNGVIFTNPGTPNDVGFLRITGTGESDTVLELGTGDDGATTNSEAIAARLYRNGSVVKEAWLLDTLGNSSFPGTLALNNKHFNYALAFEEFDEFNKTGMVVITLPHGFTNGMNLYEIDMYNYEDDNTTPGKAHSKLTLGFYNYITTDVGLWYRYGYTQLGPWNDKVRLAYNSNGKCCIILGDADTVWDYPHIFLSRVLSAHGSEKEWSSGYTITWETSLDSYTKVTTVNRTDLIFDTVIANTFKGNLTGTASSTNRLLSTTHPIKSTDEDTVANWGALGTSIHYLGSTAQITDKPHTYGFVLNISNGNTEVHLLWLTQALGNLAHRGGNANGWEGTWRTILDSTNYSSILNSSYVTKDSLGSVRIRKDLGGNLSQFGTYLHKGPLEVGRSSNSMCLALGVTDDNYGYIQSKGESITNTGSLILQPRGGELLYGQSKSTIWHSGNDGAESGLDADTVDSWHRSYFPNNYNGSRHYRIQFGLGGEDKEWKTIAKTVVVNADGSVTKPKQEAPTSNHWTASMIKGRIFRLLGNYNQGLVIEYPFEAIFHYTSGTSLIDTATLYLPLFAKEYDNIRIVKLETNVYELQVKMISSWLNDWIEFQGSGTVLTCYESLQAASTSGKAVQTADTATILTLDTTSFAYTATKATQDSAGNVIKDTYLKKTGDTMTGHLILYKSSGDSPALVFQRGKLGEDSSVDWRMYVSDGKFLLQRITGTTDTPGAWTNVLNFNTGSSDTNKVLTSSYSITAPSFTGNLEGNADSATKLSLTSVTTYNNLTPEGVVVYLNTNGTLDSNGAGFGNTSAALAWGKSNCKVMLSARAGKNDSEVYIRQYYTSWGNWYKLIHSGNISSYVDLSSYATQTYVDTAIANALLDGSNVTIPVIDVRIKTQSNDLLGTSVVLSKVATIDLSSYAKLTDIPTSLPADGGTADGLTGYTFKTASSVTHSGWVNTTTDDKIIPTMSFIAYWNGAHTSGGNSNLTYCKKGAFGDAAVKGVTTSVTNGTDKDYLVTSGGVYSYINNNTALTSNTTNAVSITVGNTTKNITAATLKTSLGLGSNAYSSTAYLPLTGGTLSGAITFSNTSPITWNSGSYHQRINITDDANVGTEVFTFQQSTTTGSTWDNLVTIRDTGTLSLYGSSACSYLNGLKEAKYAAIDIATSPVYTLYSPWIRQTLNNGYYVSLGTSYSSLHFIGSPTSTTETMPDSRFEMCFNGGFFKIDCKQTTPALSNYITFPTIITSGLESLQILTESTPLVGAGASDCIYNYTSLQNGYVVASLNINSGAGKEINLTVDTSIPMFSCSLNNTTNIQSVDLTLNLEIWVDGSLVKTMGYSQFIIEPLTLLIISKYATTSIQFKLKTPTVLSGSNTIFRLKPQSANYIYKGSNFTITWKSPKIDVSYVVSEVFTLNKSDTATRLYTDGFVISSANLTVYSNPDCFFVRKGNNCFRLSSDGIQYSIDGGRVWNSLL